MPRETTLWLIRHPEPEASAIGRCYGSLDLSLSGAGIRQAHAVAAFLSRVPLTAIYTSPLLRCAQAAEIIASGKIPLSLVNSQTELHFGDFEGRTYDEIAALYPALYREWMESPTEVQFPRGESFSQMQSRVLQSRDELLRSHSGETIALVTHGGNIRILICDALGIPAPNLFRIGLAYAGLSCVRYVDSVPIVDHVNIDAQKFTGTSGTNADS